MNISFSKVIMPLHLGIWEKKLILWNLIIPLLRIVYALFEIKGEVLSSNRVETNDINDENIMGARPT